jgi:U5 small nuclear ribonucleoprotein component
MCQTEALLKYCVTQRIPMTLVINKVDRLIVELKIPPADAYHKLRHTIEEINTLMK